ncbi:MAG: 2-C-methyl-D-erythritol 4-phosphate cytidylyltransferase [Bacillota bacterium]
MIVAAGESRRMQGMGDKVLLSLLGKPLLLYSLELFSRLAAVEQIVLVINPRLRPQIEQLLHSHGYRDICLVSGGASRQESVYRGLLACRGRDLVAIHDAARPCLREEDALAVIAAARQQGAAILATPVTDTVKRVQAGRVIESPPREQMWAAQTPQVFRWDWIAAAHRRASQTGISATDDAELVALCGHPVDVVRGSARNIKVTTPDDLLLAELIMTRGDKPWQ